MADSSAQSTLFPTAENILNANLFEIIAPESRKLWIMIFNLFKESRKIEILEILSWNEKGAGSWAAMNFLEIILKSLGDIVTSC